jgi:integrating conjugative element protein (TIGR03757 family)
VRHLLAFTVMLAAGVAQADPRVEVFTDRANPIIHTEAFAQVRVVRIDGLVLAQEYLSEGLPMDENAAAKLANARLTARPDLKDQMMAAGEGLALSHLQYQLDRYPAIVFDGMAVIYGVTDLAVAKRLYEQRL